MYIKIYLLLIILFFQSGSYKPKPVIFDPAIAELTARQYYKYLELCSTESNSYEYRTQIIYDLCEDPQIKIISDLPTSPGESTEINDYLNNINQISKNGTFSIRYDENISIVQCRSENNLIWGSQARKTIFQKGKLTTFNEILEIGLIEGSYKILSIKSNFLRDIEISCSNSLMAEDNSCKLIELAATELRENKTELAVAHLEESKACGIVDDDHTFKSIEKINLDSIYKVSFEKGILLMQENKFSEALMYFNSIKRSYTTINSTFLSQVNAKILYCNAENTYQNTLEQADFYFNQNNFNKSLELYKDLFEQKNSSLLQARILECEAKIRVDYEREMVKELATVEEMMQSGNNRKQAAAFRILMKYRYSDLLSGKDYFYAAQIAESPSSEIKSEFGINGHNQCLLTRQMLLNAFNKGYNSEGFQIYWNEYLKEKNRTCD